MRLILGAVAILTLCASAFGQNLLSNPSLETVPVDPSDWTGSDWFSTGDAGAGHGNWAARDGNVGGYFPGWNSTFTSAGLRQRVSDVSTGTDYTFTFWASSETNFHASALDMRIVWYDADSNELDRSAADWSHLPRDARWHQVFVSGSCESQDLAFAEVEIYGEWTVEAGPNQAFRFDQAEFFAGAYAGARLGNGSFETGQETPDVSWTNGLFLGSMWQNTDETVCLRRDWAARSGAWGAACYGWSAGDIAIAQAVNPTSEGTYTFAVWMKREANFDLSSATLRIEWFDFTFTNKVAADSTSTLTVPNDNEWHQYHVTGECWDSALYEARVSIEVAWLAQDNALSIDDARFLTGEFSENAIDENWGYHNAEGYYAAVEPVPGTNVGAFLQVDTDADATTFYVMAHHPSVALYPEETGTVGLRTSYYDPEALEWINAEQPMTLLTTITLTNNQFHGYPSMGVTPQVDIWTCVWTHPTNAAGETLTNTIDVYYAPCFHSYNGGVLTDSRYLVEEDGASTNLIGQQFHSDVVDRDYSFVLNPGMNAVLLNPGFEDPEEGDTSISVGWTPWGDTERAQWGLRSGKWGGVFRSWSEGNGGLYQDVEVSSDTYTFTLWIRQNPGVVPVEHELALEWYTDSGIVQRDSRDITTVPTDGRWHRVFITGTCPVPGINRIRPVLIGSWEDGTVPNYDSINFDDAELYAGAYTSKQAFVNGDFEMPGTNSLIGSTWDGVPAGGSNFWVGIDSWAALSNSWGASFRAWEQGQESYSASLSQPLGVDPGQYEFGVWINRESGILLTNLELRIEWFDSTLTNRVQPDSVNRVDPPGDTSWNFYTVTGNCVSADLFEARPTIFAQWARNTNDVPGKTMKADCAVFTRMGQSIIPDWWWAQYGLSTTNTADGDNDNDTFDNLEEYLADTNPTNPASFFRGVSEVAGGRILGVTIESSSIGRVYDVYWKSNLVESGEWIPYGFNRQGNGFELILQVTNEVPNGFFRTGVGLP